MRALFQGQLSCSLSAHLDRFWDLSIEIPRAGKRSAQKQPTDAPQPRPNSSSEGDAAADGSVASATAAEAPVDIVMALRNFCKVIE
jgi:hypothetical protein